MATNPPSFFNPESISYDQYSKGPVDFYNQALDVDSLAGTGIDIVNPDDITKLKDYGIAGGDDDGGDTQDDALNALDATSIQGDFVGGSMFPGGTGIEYNNFNAYNDYDSYSDYITGEKPPGMADRVDFISNVMEPLTSGRFGDINFAAGTEGLADRVGKDVVEGVTKPDAKTGIKGALVVANPMLGLAGSAILSTTTVRNAFGNISARPDGILGMVADAVHATQYADMAHNRAVARANMTDFRESVSGMTEDRFQDDSLAGRFAADRDIGFSMSFGSGTGAGGITRKAGTFTYTGNMRGLDNQTLKNMEAVQRGFVPSTFGNRNFGFDYTGRGATTFEEAGYSEEVAGGGRYTNDGKFMDKYGRVSAMGLASHSKSLAGKYGLSVGEINSILSATRTGKGNLIDNINAAKANKASKAQAQADRQQEQAAQDAYNAARASQSQREIERSGGGGDGGYEGPSGNEAGSGAGGGFGLSHAKGGKVQGYALGTPPPGVQASQSGFVDRPPSQVSEAGKVADDRPMKAKEGTYVINAAAVEFAGEQDIRKMIMDAQKEAVRRGLSTGDFERHSDLVDIAVSRGEVTVAPHLVDIIGEDRLEKINKRGIRKTEQRIAENGQEPVQAAGGGFITRKKFHSGGGVHSHNVKAAVGISGTSKYGMTSEDLEIDHLQKEQYKRKSATPTFKSKAEEELYNQGVQFGDTEVFADILGKTNFNKLIQAAARDSRTLSDTVTTLRPGENVANPYHSNAMGLYAQYGREPYTSPVYEDGEINYTDSLNNRTGAKSTKDFRADVSNSAILMRSPAGFGGPSTDYLKPPMAYTATLAHELMHKGADILANDPNFNPSRSLVAMQGLYARLPSLTRYIDDEIDFETYSKAKDEKRTSGDAEHRYIAAVIGQAYLRRNIESVAGAFEKSQRPPKGFEDSFGKVTGSDLVNEAKQNILYETRRVFESYLTPANRKQFFEENSLFELNPEYDSLDLKIGRIYNRKDVNEIPFEELAAAYDSINRIMAEDYAAILFKNAVVDKPVNIPRRKTSPKPASAKAPLQDATGAAIGSQPQKYERGFLDKMLGVTPAY